MIIDRLIEIAISKLNSQKVKDLRIGLGYTCILLDDETSGLAFIFLKSLVLDAAE
jgi:uncharacterized protein (DUF4213/DUF364 family)